MSHIMNADDIDAKAIDTLAEDLAKLTGETKAQATAKALADRLARARAARGAGRGTADPDFRARIKAHAADLRRRYDLDRPVTKAEWDLTCGDEA